MGWISRLFSAIALAAGLAAPLSASAGLIVLVGDSNFASAVGFADPANPGNKRFFRNVLGTGTDVVVQSTSGGGSPAVDAADTIVTNFYNGLGGGVSASLVAGPITAAMLAGADLFVVIVPDAAYSSAEVAAFSGFLRAGGTMFLFGENFQFATQNGYLNTLLADLGSTMSIVSLTAFSDTTPVTHALTTGVATAATTTSFLLGSALGGGTPLFTTRTGPVSNRRVLVAAEQIDPRQVPLPATLVLVGMGVAAMLAVRRRRG